MKLSDVNSLSSSPVKRFTGVTVPVSKSGFTAYDAQQRVGRVRLVAEAVVGHHEIRAFHRAGQHRRETLHRLLIDEWQDHAVGARGELAGGRAGRERGGRQHRAIEQLGGGCGLHDECGTDSRREHGRKPGGLTRRIRSCAEPGQQQPRRRGQRHRRNAIHETFAAAIRKSLHVHPMRSSRLYSSPMTSARVPPDCSVKKIVTVSPGFTPLG